MSNVESDEIVQKWLKEHEPSFGHFIENKWYKPADRKTYVTKNPCNGKTLAATVQGNEDDVNYAVKCANEAAKTWGAMSGHERARHLYNVARCVEKHLRLFALVESMDNGKAVCETMNFDVPTFIKHLDYHAGWAELMDDEFKGRWKAVGVVGCIVPWNFPLMLLGWKICPALAMGNTVVLKPATYTRLSALLFAEICAEAGLPPGVFNVITGNGAMGSILAAHPDIDKVAFTGSTEIGKELRKTTAGSGKKLSLELGGKSPMIVYESADLEQVVNGVMVAIYFNQGQVCCAGSKLIVQESVYDKLVEMIKKRLSTFRVGDCLRTDVSMGALVDTTQWQTVEDYVQSARVDGATVFQSWDSLPEGSRATPEEVASGKLKPKGCGLFYPPTVITNVKLTAKVVVEEIFGPVVCVLPFKTPLEALEIANNTMYGLGGSAWTKNVSLGLETCLGIKAGAIWFNCYNAFDPPAGFGGYKQSGYGRDGGKEGLMEFIKPSWMKNFRGERGPMTNRTLEMEAFGKKCKSEGVCEKGLQKAFETAKAAQAVWGKRAAFNRSKIVWYLAEQLEKQRLQLAKLLSEKTGQTEAKSLQEVDAAVSRCFYWASWADKYGGEIQETSQYGVTMRLNEPMGVIGITCPDEYPLLSFVSLLAPAIVRANAVVIVPSEKYPEAGVQVGKILSTSSLMPSGVVNVLTGERDHLGKLMADHPDFDSTWYFGSAEGSKYVEYMSHDNLKRTFVNYGRERSWEEREQGQGLEFLYHATQAKNIWMPITESFYQ